ncbi:MAG: hypothetical protein AAFX44_06500 [Pseudomonadota bacterium]
MICEFEQLRALSGFQRKSAVMRWCSDNGISYFLNALGQPVTTEAELTRALHDGDDRPNKPDLTWMKQA